MRLVKCIPDSIKPILKNSFIYRYLYLRMQSRVKFPYAISIELTNRCNLKCRMCPRPKIKNLDVGDMDFEFFKKIVDDFAKFTNKKTSFTLVALGEPLMYNNLSDAIEYVKMKCQNVPIHINTNATLLDEEKSKMLCMLLGGGRSAFV